MFDVMNVQTARTASTTRRPPPGAGAMAMRLTIDGHLVAHGRADSGIEQCELYLFHEYGNWSVLTVTSAVDGGAGRASSGSAAVHVEQHASFDGVLAAVHGGCENVRWHALRRACTDAGRLPCFLPPPG